MLIVRHMGFLGNQMFINAYVEAMKYEGYDVKIDLSYYDYLNGTYDLERIFGIHQETATLEECRQYGSPELDRFHRAVRKLLFPWLKKKSHRILKHDKNMIFYPEFMHLDDCFLECYLQSEKYFYKIRDQIKEMYRFPDLDAQNVSIAKKIQDTNSVSIHIRRGDYLKHSNPLVILELSYYKNAIRYMQEYIPNLVLFVFSNDMNWCKEHLGDVKECYYVEGNTGSNSFRDMQLMSLCKHNIIGNSSFSWWGAWLNENKNKIVCAPDKWFSWGRTADLDIIPEEWTLLSIQ